MKYTAALVLLLSLAALTTTRAAEVSASEKDGDTSTSTTTKPGTPAPTTKPGTPAPTTKPGTPAPTTKPGTPAPTTKPGTPAPTTKPGTPGPTTKPGSPGGGKGDPIMTGFDGRNFEFFGKAGNFYNVISEKSHQLSMKLKEGHMWDHEGSYVSAMGFQHQDHTLLVENEGDSMIVTLDGEKLVLGKDETEVEHILGMASGEMQVLWQLHRAELGNAVEITTNMLQVVVWVTPAGTRDEGGKVQPAYLNFDVSLLATPAHNALEGIVGRTFFAKAEENDFKFHGEEADFEMASFFDAAHPKCLLGKTTRMAHARKLIESGRILSLPMRAGFSSQ